MPSRSFTLIGIWIALALIPFTVWGQGVSEQDTGALRSRGFEPTPDGAIDFLSQLSETESNKDIQALIEQLGSEQFQVREAAETELVGLGQTAASDLRAASISEDIEIKMRADRILARLNDDDTKLATLAALRITREAKQPSAANVLLEFLPTASNHSIRIAAMKALRSVAAPVHDDALRAALHNEDALVRSASVYALGKLLADEQVADLNFLLDDQDDWVRLVAAQLTTRRGDRRALKTIVGLLRSNDSRVRQASVRILRQCSEQSFEFEPNGAKKSRHNAIAAWSKWIASHPDFEFNTTFDDIVMSPVFTASRWRLQYALPNSEKKSREIVLRPDGRLEISGGTDNTKDNDFWIAKGMSITLTFNDKYVEYKGTLTDNNTMSGEALNIKGLEWSWRATRLDAK